MQELDPRKQTILHAIVVEYISTADPVGSELLTQKYQLGVKSATVRNEMAELAEMGFLEQPHTSAGRVPSDAGYRYYVDRLIVQRDPEAEEKQRVAKATSERDALESLLRDTVRALSRVTHLLSVATTLRDPNLTVRHAVVSALGPSQALLVLVLSNGHVENRLIECPPGLTLQDVGRANELLSTATDGKSLRGLSRLKVPAATGNVAMDVLLSALCASLRAVARDLTRGLMVIEGAEYMLAQPEFRRDAGSLAELLQALTESDLLYEAVAPGEQAQTVTIGRENRQEQMRQLSVVRHSFFVGDNETGVLALVGPTRMRYESSIPLVGYTAKALSQSLTRSFG